MKKYLFILFSLILCFSFVFSGCNLFTEDVISKGNKIVVEAGNIKLSREELLKGYNNYYSTFYNNNNGNSQAAMNDLIDYLVSKKIYLRDAERLKENGDIVISDAENNYLWNSVYNALIKNIETFENKVKKELEIEEEKEEELEQEAQFIYTPYNKIAEVVYNEYTQQYEISIIQKKMVEIINEETGEKEYKYLSIEEADGYTVSEIFSSVYIKNLVNIKKLYQGQDSLTEEEKENKSISQEAIRRYLEQLRDNEEGKGLSTDDESIFEREINRIYNVVYENLLINKLYMYKISEIDVSEEDVLDVYLELVGKNYERYLLDEEAFTKELTTTVGSAKAYAGYSKESDCIEDIFYIPKNSLENFFYLTHIVISASESQVQQINELREYCEAKGIDIEEPEGYYMTEFNKIFDMSKIKLDERDSEGYIIIKSTDENSISIEQMFENLKADMQEIYDKYYDEEGLITIALNDFIKEKLEIDYQNERADKFNEYIYKYTDDTGTLQIQKTLIGNNTNENWYTYALGTGKTDAGFVSNFVEKARSLYNNGLGKITDFDIMLMQNWTKDSIPVLKTGSTGYSIIMYCGKASNLFESFDEDKFDLADILEEEGEYGRYYSLLKMDYYRLGLTMNKTLFDLVFEKCYDKLYNDIIKTYEDSILEEINIVKYKKVYSDLIK